MRSEPGTGEHTGSPAAINPLQMDLFESEADDRT